MSVSIATMGMFNPALVGETVTKYVEVDRGSSDGWWLRAKPQIIIRSVMEDDRDDKDDRDRKPIVKILEVTNGNGKV